MIDQESVERAAERFKAPDGGLERLIRRRDRKRRNQRIAAGVVGIAVFLAAVWIVTNGLPFDSSQPPAVPGNAGTVTNARITGQSAGAIDDEFRGWYRVIGRNGRPGDFRDRVRVLYVSERFRYLALAGLVWSGRLAYVPGELFPWQTTNDTPFRYELRYRRRTDTAVGIRTGLEGRTWDVRLVPIG